MDRLLASAAFQDYARAAQVARCERALFAAYVAYMARVIRPAQRVPATHALLSLLVPGRG